jgi:hypothetical protein
MLNVASVMVLAQITEGQVDNDPEGQLIRKRCTGNFSNWPMALVSRRRWVDSNQGYYLHKSE